VRARIKRALGIDDPRPRLVHPSRDRAEEFWRWLADFEPRTVDTVRALVAAEHGGTVGVLPTKALDQFKLKPGVSIELVRRTFERLADLDASLVIWCLDEYHTHSLDEVEAEALFGGCLAIEAIERVKRSADWKKLLVVGRPRTEHVGLAFEIGAVTGASALSTWLGLELLQAPLSSVRASVLFVDHDTAAFLAARPAHVITLAVRSGAESGAFAIGAIVRATHAADAQALGDELAAVRALATGPAVTWARVRPTAAYLARPELLRLLRAEGIVSDLSFVSGLQGSPAAFQSTGAYWPQRFDARTPAGVRSADVPVEIVAIDAASRGPWRAWHEHTAFDPRLESLLSFESSETFHRDLEPMLQYAQRYHEYRVFNWPPSDGRERTTLLDGGIVGPVSVTRLVRFGSRLARQIARVDFPGPSFAALAESEASSRLLRADQALRHQQDAHGYLETTPREGQLREDYRRFVEFMPAQLGDVLELGSGFGQLAAVLRSRTTRYVCLELDRNMLRDIKARTGVPGVVADIHRLPFRDAAFETVVANNVIEHAYDPVGALTEIRRVLRPAGRFLALLPLDALNPSHQLRTHWWKADETNIASALAMAGLTPNRLERLNLYDLGVRGAFPSCDGWGCAVEALRG
jgi:SAM-dependent methyltransferase